MVDKVLVQPGRVSKPQDSDLVLGELVQQVVDSHVGGGATQNPVTLGHFLKEYEGH